jgi:AICAR transformylase/IMP cyclohydrolase PurH
VVTYDATIAQYLDTVKLEEKEETAQVATIAPVAKPVIRAYDPQFELKYGANPHQKPSAVLRIVSNLRLSPILIPL